MYHRLMRRINIHLDEDLDAELAAAAVRLGESKAELIRRAAREWLDRNAAAPTEDAWQAFTGSGTANLPEEYRHLDELIYGVKRRP
jgi:metal-responsive CopG/Arc/MetJ family transcriptional regulator